jgi:transcription termination factor Rho
MNKAELESKHLSELHALAADAGIDRYRMLPRPELIEKLAGGSGGSGGSGSGEGGESRGGSSRRSRPPRERKERQPRSGGRDGGRDRPRRERQPRGGGEQRGRQASKQEEPRREEPQRAAAPSSAGRGEEPAKPKRRRRRRFRRKGGKTVHAHEMLVPSVPGRQAIVYADTREACTALLRELAAELSGGKGPDPVALLVDPTPEELADWKREAPKAEIVSAGQERHAEDALSAAARRADEGEAVVLLIDSLSRVAEAFGGSSVAKDLFDAGQAAGSAGGGSLTVVAAVERAS